MNGKYLCGKPIKTNQASFKKVNEAGNYNNYESTQPPTPHRCRRVWLLLRQPPPRPR